MVRRIPDKEDSVGEKISTDHISKKSKSSLEMQPQDSKISENNNSSDSIGQNILNLEYNRKKINDMLFDEK